MVPRLLEQGTPIQRGIQVIGLIGGVPCREYAICAAATETRTISATKRVARKASITRDLPQRAYKRNSMITRRHWVSKFEIESMSDEDCVLKTTRAIKTPEKPKPKSPSLKYRNTA